ncbi:MAG: DUF6709 family protein [Roseiflexaceae bacterium]
MTNSLVHATIRRSNRNQLVLCIVGVLLLAGFAALNTRYLYNFFSGPFSIDKRTLLATEDAGTLRQYWVTVEGDDVADTGFQMVRRSQRSGSESVTASYMALLLDDKVLVVKAQDDKSVTKYTGYIETMPSDIRTRIVADAEQDMPEMRGAFLPYILNTDGFRGTGYIALGLGIPLFLLCVWGLMRAIKRSNDPSVHPIMRALSRFGPADYVAGQIDAELQADHPKVGKLHLTPSWLVQAASARLDATRLDDVVWAYKQVTQHRTNGIPTGKTYAAQIWDRYGVCITVAGKEAFVNQALEAAAQRAPWLLTGYSAELEKTWKQNRAAVIDAVEQRRRQIMGQGVPAQA